MTNEIDATVAFVKRARRKREQEAALKTTEAKPSSDGAELARLAKLSQFEYERERKEAAERLGMRASVLDRAIEQSRKKLATAAKELPELDPDELKRSATDIIKHHNILELFDKEFGKVIAGETINGKLIYLVGTSRLFEKTMNAAIKGTSAGGKSEIRKRALEFFPPEKHRGFY